MHSPARDLRRLHVLKPTSTTLAVVRRSCCKRAGKYLEIFGRKNNLHNFWVTIGNEVTGTGLPVEDEAAVKGGQRIPGAVYGAGR